MNLENNLKVAKHIFKGDIRKKVIEQIETFYNALDNYELPKSQYKKHDDVKLSKGTFLHGIIYDIDNTFDLVVKNSFIAPDFSDTKTSGKYPYTIGFWNIQEDILLKDYIIIYSGATIEYSFRDGKKETKIIPYNKMNEELDSARNSDFWMWRAEQTKEIRFMPSLTKDTNQIAFIINMNNEYAKKLIEMDIFRNGLTKADLKSFVDKRFVDKFINTERDDFFTNREAAIVFGLPSCFIEGILVGRKYENNKEKLKMIKNKLPNCYICNLDGKVIIE